MTKLLIKQKVAYDKVESGNGYEHIIKISD